MQPDPTNKARLVGRYVVHDRIAAGGMATVHLGRLLGPAGFSRTVAIKRLHDGYARDPDFVAMLLDEARLAATIRHPNVVPTLDVVAEADELLVVMEYVEGESLAHLAKSASLRGQRIPVAFAASMIAQALHGLHAAHEARDKNGEPLGIVHRDVSPQNVLVGADGLARVLDFGIAKAASRATSTEGGQIKGKTAYMAPEQLQHANVDRRTDVFAAAVVLWELLAGRRLFLADSPPETIARVLNAPIEPPQRIAEGVPDALGAITMRGLERDPERRWPTAEAMAHALEDAVKLPRAKEIGAWVSEMAAGTLRARAELVQAVERSSHRLATAAVTTELRSAIAEAERRREMADLPTDVGAARAPAPAAAVPMPMPSGPELTQLSTVNTAHGLVVPPPRVSRGSLALGIVGACALAGALAVAFVVWRDRLPTTPAAIAAPPPAEHASVAPPHPVESVASSPPPAASASASASASARPTTSTTATGIPWSRRSHGGAAKKPGCEVPWEVDDQGLKHFKVECL